MQWTWPARMDIKELMARLKIFGEHKGYAVNFVGGDIVEFKKGGNLRLVSGLSTGLRLVITHKADATVVDVSEHGKEYAIKGAVATAGIWLAFIPTATAAYGAYAQNKLMDEVKKEINDYYDDI
jgi:hypothetical protein